MSKNRNSSRKGRRVTPANANRRLPTVSIRSSQLDLEDFLRDIEDRRTFHPDQQHRNARSFHSASHALKAAPSSPRNRKTVPSGVAFVDPQEVLVCVRRKQRKEVLHALKKSGKTGQKSPRRNFYSDIHC